MPNSKYKKQHNRFKGAFMMHVLRNTAKSPNVIGTGLKGSIMAQGLNIQITAVISPTKVNLPVDNLKLSIFISCHYTLDSFTGT